MEMFHRRVIMAPMAGVNTPAFCDLLRDNGCDFIYTGLLTSHGLVRRNDKTGKILDELPSGVTLAGQIFGSDPAVMAASAQALIATGKVHLIDINMGCPVRKVVKSSAGARLMREPALAAEIVRTVAAAVKAPVTVKMRAGWDSNNINFLDLAARCRDSGAAAVALHPRTRVQGFSGDADWSLIARLKETLDIPVIASGDITDEDSAERCFRETGCDSIMIGRAAMGNPRLIGRIRHFLETGEKLPPPGFRTRLADARRQLIQHVDMFGQPKGVREMRGPLTKYVFGLPDATTFRAAVNRTGTLEGVLQLIDEYAENLKCWEAEGKMDGLCNKL